MQLTGVSRHFGETVALQHINLAIRAGELFALLGSSGCGKTTLLRIVAGLETLTSGHVYLDGKDISPLPPYRRPVNMMFQSYALFPHMTVEENIAFGLRQESLPRSEVRQRVSEMLALVQMQRYAQRRPHQLSGGQQQRVALARSLAKRPRLLLLDEPMSALDKQIRTTTQAELCHILREVGVTCVLVTHDQEEAMSMADRIAVMNEGRILQVGPPIEVYAFPNSRFVAEFVGNANLFEATVAGRDAGQLILACAQLRQPLRTALDRGWPVGSSIQVCVRPEHVALSRTPPMHTWNTEQGSVDEVTYRGSHSTCRLRLESGQMLVADIPGTVPGRDNTPAPGVGVWASWPADAAVVLDPAKTQGVPGP
ncbi:Spermidine/putrescine import ATP-binding protein PotA [Cupriavidus laharis]|uniref:Spermidine/putrescine import ATP-binding protein PotA n=1 Tax=Cupriavidus laharis TaxID=151654 RepID=A0ABN7YFV7_9BURK|nr:ABC transporter ATP-binding protein [Cupriavidus laharis]CAG9171097.1 Spermidine/putrescine import ATP-binding protein PotA [Cupriavidus laharis]